MGDVPQEIPFHTFWAIMRLRKAGEARTCRMRKILTMLDFIAAELKALKETSVTKDELRSFGNKPIIDLTKAKQE